MKQRILIVEDDALLADGMSRALRNAGLSVHCLMDGVHALDALGNEPYDLLILDLGLPRLDGIELLRRLRNQGNAIPVLVVTARHAVAEKVEGLNAGADDYLTKPFDLSEFEARVSALLRRRLPEQPAARQHSDAPQIDEETPSLTPREQCILDVLLARQDEVVTREYLAKQIALGEEEFTENACQVQISRLRRKLSASGLNIRTVRGFGYMLQKKPAQPGKPS